MSLLPSPDDYEITPSELAALMETASEGGEPPIRLVDCREEDEYAICRIEGAELVPLSRFAEEALRRFRSSDDTRLIVVYCHHGRRSLHATAFLRERGHRQTWSLAGGIDLWSRQIDPAVPRY